MDSKEKEHSSEEDDSSEPGDEVFVVEKILDKRIIKKGKTSSVEYLIKWKGYNEPGDNTWEPEENCQCPELIEEFEKEYKNRKKGSDDGKKRIKEKSSSVQKETENQLQKPRHEKEGSKENGGIKPSTLKKPLKSKETVISSDSSDEPSTKKTTTVLEDTFLRKQDLPEPHPNKTYEVQEGKMVANVLGVKKNEKNEMIALVRYEDNKYELVPTSVLCAHAPKVIMDFYEFRLRFF
jgi:hypothetical protein